MFSAGPRSTLDLKNKRMVSLCMHRQNPDVGEGEPKLASSGRSTRTHGARPSCSNSIHCLTRPSAERRRGYTKPPKGDCASLLRMTGYEKYLRGYLRWCAGHAPAGCVVGLKGRTNSFMATDGARFTDISHGPCLRLVCAFSKWVVAPNVVGNVTTAI